MMNTNIARSIMSALALVILVNSTRLAFAVEKTYEPNWASLDQRPTPGWYLDAKFGVFIHWGVYAVPAWGAPGQYAEWYWKNMSDRNPTNVWWQFHKKNYGENFEYKDFYAALHR